MAHLPLNQIVFTPNVYYVFDVLIQVVSFDLLAPADYIDFGFTESDPYSDNFEWLGYESSNLFENLGSIALFASFIILKNTFSFGCFFCLRKCKCKCFGWC